MVEATSRFETGKNANRQRKRASIHPCTSPQNKHMKVARPWHHSKAWLSRGPPTVSFDLPDRATVQN